MLIKIIKRLLALLFSTDKSWQKISKEKENHEEFINNFLFPIFGFISITTFIGGMWIANNGGIHYALKITIAVVTALFGGFYVASILINELFPKYGMVKDKLIAQQFVGYSSIVIYLIYLFLPFLQGLNIIWALALYSLLLIYSGVNHFLEIDKDKRVLFSIIAFIVIFLSPILLNYLLQLTII